MGSWFAALAAGALIALINAVAIGWWLDSSAVSARVRASHHLLDATQHLALALLIPSAQAAYRRALKPASLQRLGWRQQRWLRPLLPWAWSGVGLMLLFAPTLAEDLDAFAHSRFAGAQAELVKWGLVGGCAAGLASALVLLNRFWSAPLALLATASAVALFGANHWLLKHNYPGVHLLIALAGLGLVTVAWAPLRWFRGGPPPWLQRSAGAVAVAATVASVLALFAPPSRTLLIEQLKTSGSVVPWWATRLRQYTHHLTEAAFHPGRSQWFEQSTRAATPTSQPGLLADAPILLLITIDAVRADVLETPHHLERLPNLRALKEQGVYFSQGRAPGSQTVTSLSGMFSGLYFSQQYWTRHPEVGYLFLGDDPSPRFPELLQATGYETHTAAATYFLVNTFGIVRGFEHEEFIKTPGLALSDYTPGRRLTARLSDALKNARNEPLFLFAHYLDSHFPYKAGATGSGSATGSG
ncbi:MAG TPA: sulfatase-like hydrolase/transferase, partial [Polyangiaceae bacterium]